MAGRQNTGMLYKGIILIRFEEIKVLNNVACRYIKKKNKS